MSPKSPEAVAHLLINLTSIFSKRSDPRTFRLNRKIRLGINRVLYPIIIHLTLNFDFLWKFMYRYSQQISSQLAFTIDKHPLSLLIVITKDVIPRA